MRPRARLLIVAGLVLTFGIVFANTAMDYLAPFILACLFSAVLDPIVDGLERKGMPRSLGTLGAMIVVGLSLLGSVWALTFNLLREAELLRVNVPQYVAALREAADRWLQAMKWVTEELPPPFDQALAEWTEQLVVAAGGLVPPVIAWIGALPGAAVVLMVASLTAYFITRDKRQLSAFLFRQLPKGWHNEATRLKQEIVTGILGYVRAQAILVGLSAVLSVAGLQLFGYRYAWSLGILAGVLDLAPMIGPSGVFVPLIFIGLVNGHTVRTLGVVCVWLVVLLARQIVEPEVVGKHVGLHPVTSIVAVYFGGRLLGAHGLLLGPIIAVIIKAVCVVSVLPLLRRQEP